MYRYFNYLFTLYLLAIASTACGGSSSKLTPTSAEPVQATSPTIASSPTEIPARSEPTVTQAAPPTHTAPPPIPTPTSPVEMTVPSEFPVPGNYQWLQIAGNLLRPIGLANAGDGLGRLFIIEQAGVIRVLQDGDLLPVPFLDISDQVDCCGERGLLGLAFHPEYARNGEFFVHYSDLNGDTVLARFQVDLAERPDQADPDSQVIILRVAQPYGNHNGGTVAFGLDGYLYLGLGDGGSGGDPLGNAQNLDSLLGKLLRLDVDSGDPYAIPPDNPYAQGGGAPEIWASGLRNPWRFSFDRLTGDLFIGDVGQSSWEEIDFLPAGGPGGANFGWNYREGAHPFSTSSPPGELLLTDPVAEYGRDQGITVIGGVVYRGGQLPEWEGIYLYGDYGSGFIWGLFQGADGSWRNAVLFETGSSITSFGQDENGEVYYVDLAGNLFRLDVR